METIQDHLELVNRSKIQLDSARRVWLGQHSILYCGQSPTQTILEPPQLGQKHLRRDLSSSFARFSQPVTIIFLQNCLSVHIYLVFSLYQEKAIHLAESREVLTFHIHNFSVLSLFFLTFCPFFPTEKE